MINPCCSEVSITASDDALSSELKEQDPTKGIGVLPGLLAACNKVKLPGPVQWPQLCPSLQIRATNCSCSTNTRKLGCRKVLLMPQRTPRDNGQRHPMTLLLRGVIAVGSPYALGAQRDVSRGWLHTPALENFLSHSLLSHSSWEQ